MAENKDKAYTFIFNEILDKILQLSENPSQFADYLTQQIREIVGARTIVIAIKNTHQQAEIYSVFPERRKEWANQAIVLQLTETSFEFENIQFLDKDSKYPNIPDILRNLDIEKTIAIPLVASGVKVGSILLFDIMDSFGAEAVLDLLTRLSGISALIIRNSILYHNLEETVIIRTQELQKKNEELSKANLQLNENLIHIQDINSKLEESKQKAEESEDMLQHVIQATDRGVWKWDIATNGEYFSPHWCEIIGYSFDDKDLEHTFNSWANRIHPDDYDRVMHQLDLHLKDNTPYNVDYRHLHKSGEYRWQNSTGKQ